MLLTGTTRVRAGASADAEVGAYGGDAVQQWICGPKTGVRYGGLGADVRVRPLAIAGIENRSHEGEPGHAQNNASSDDRNTAPRGLAVAVGGAAEYRHYRLIERATRPAWDEPCQYNYSGCYDSGDDVPPTGVLLGGHGRVGYDFSWFGIYAGALGYQRYGVHHWTQPKTKVLPEVSLRLGRIDGCNVELGFGSADPTMMLRPGLFLTVHDIPLGDFRLRLGAGLHDAADMVSARLSATVLYPVGGKVDLGLGATYFDGPQGQLVARFRL
jgi:hypothetical protein